MPDIANDPIAVSSGGIQRSEKPAAPSLSVSASDGTVVATISGDDNVTNYLKYKSTSQSEWQDGGSRSGDGTITVEGLASGVLYIFVAYSEDDTTKLISLPSAPQHASFAIADSTENEFDAMLADSADDFLTELGEEGEYLPVGGGSREITAIVDREPPIELEGGPRTSLLFITVKNDSDEGISSSEVNFSGDKYKLPVNIGETAVEKKIARRVYQDAGMMMLELV